MFAGLAEHRGLLKFSSPYFSCLLLPNPHPCPTLLLLSQQISTLEILNLEDQGALLSDDEIFASRQTGKHTCMALRKYFEAHLAIKLEQVKQSLQRTEGGILVHPQPPYKVRGPCLTGSAASTLCGALGRKPPFRSLGSVCGFLGDPCPTWSLNTCKWMCRGRTLLPAGSCCFPGMLEPQGEVCVKGLSFMKSTGCLSSFCVGPL